MLVIIFDVTVKIITAPVLGYLTDLKGRKYMNLTGIIIIGVTMMAMPWFKNFPFYIFLRCLYAVGAMAISVIPLLADYVHKGSRGRCAAILVFMSSLGAVCSALINFTILKRIS
jgi:MFS family permease